MKSLDYFAEPINFKFDGGNEYFSTYLGALFTLMIGIFVLIYTGQKIASMANFENSVDIHKDYDLFSDTNIFEIPNIAFGLSSFPPDSEKDQNPDYGQIKFYYR